MTNIKICNKKGEIIEIPFLIMNDLGMIFIDTHKANQYGIYSVKDNKKENKELIDRILPISREEINIYVQMYTQK
ncbi:MAG: hypothetical protein ACQEQF_08820 [Bacillota bacterium]